MTGTRCLTHCSNGILQLFSPGGPQQRLRIPVSQCWGRDIHNPLPSLNTYQAQVAAAGTSNVTVVVTATGGTATAEGSTSSSTSSATGKRGAEPAHFLVTCSVSVQFATYVKCEIQNPFKFLSHCQNLFCRCRGCRAWCGGPPASPAPTTPPSSYRPHS